MATDRNRKKIIDAFMSLAETRDFEETSLVAIAEEAKVDLATLRDAYDGKLAILADFFRRIDMEVLKGEEEGAADETPRDRLFDVVMRRFDALAPYKGALSSLGHSARRDPFLTMALARLSSVSQNWMLTGAGIDTSGLYGLAKVNGMVLTYAKVFRTWLKDDDPGLARTMSVLDKELRRGEKVVSRLDRVSRRCGRGRSVRADDHLKDFPSEGADATAA